MKSNVITLMVILGLVAWLALHASSVEWTGVRVVGAVIAAVGVVLLVVARLQLGDSFSVSAKAKKLVTTGLYSKIRSPIYVFSAMFLVGVVITIGHWKLLLLLVVLVPLQIYRAAKEEKVLEEAFGEEYVRYKAGTWF
jgi:protein-S-isoprenylcysteine O-methyltransferase Ste14